MTVFVALVEVVPLTGCELCADDVVGGYARCYVPAPDAGAAEEAITAKLEAERLEVVQVEWCEAADEVEWESPDDEDAAASIQEAVASGGVVIGRLDVWGDEDEGVETPEA